MSFLGVLDGVLGAGCDGAGRQALSEGGGAGGLVGEVAGGRCSGALDGVLGAGFNAAGWEGLEGDGFAEGLVGGVAGGKSALALCCCSYMYSSLSH